MSFGTGLLISQGNGHEFPVVISFATIVQIKVFFVLLHFIFISNFNFRRTFNSLISSLHEQPKISIFLLVLHSGFHLLPTNFSCLNSVNQDILFPELLNILCTGIDLSFTPILSLMSWPIPFCSSGQHPMRFHNQFPEQAKVCSPEDKSNWLFCYLLSLLPSGSFSPIFHLNKVTHKHGNEIGG